MQTHPYIHAYIRHTYVCMCTWMYVCKYVTYACTTYVLMYLHAYIHTYIHRYAKLHNILFDTHAHADSRYLRSDY